MKEVFTNKWFWVIAGIIILVAIYGCRNGWFAPKMAHGGMMGMGGHGGMGHGGHGHHHNGGFRRSGNFWGYFYPYYVTNTCPTGNCDAMDGTIGTWITNPNGTCTCKSDSDLKRNDIK